MNSTFHLGRLYYFLSERWLCHFEVNAVQSNNPSASALYDQKQLYLVCPYINVLFAICPDNFIPTISNWKNVHRQCSSFLKCIAMWDTRRSVWITFVIWNISQSGRASANQEELSNISYPDTQLYQICLQPQRKNDILSCTAYRWKHCKKDVFYIFLTSFGLSDSLNMEQNTYCT